MIDGPLVQTTKVVRIPIVTSPNSQIENGHDQAEIEVVTKNVYRGGKIKLDKLKSK